MQKIELVVGDVNSCLCLAHALLEGYTIDLKSDGCACVSSPKEAMSTVTDIVFDGLPLAKGRHLVSVEDEHGRIVKAGRWVHRVDGQWALRMLHRCEAELGKVKSERDEPQARWENVVPFLHINGWRTVESNG